jgi:hypothetical protein
MPDETTASGAQGTPTVVLVHRVFALDKGESLPVSSSAARQHLDRRSLRRAGRRRWIRSASNLPEPPGLVKQAAASGLERQPDRDGSAAPLDACELQRSTL